MKILELQEIIDDAEKRFSEFLNTIEDEDSILFYKNSEIVIQFTHPAFLQVYIAAAFAGEATWFQLADVIIKNDVGNEFINLCEKYFSKKEKNIKMKKRIRYLLSKIDVSDFNIEIRYPILDIERIKFLKCYLHEQGIKQDLRKSSVRTYLYRHAK